MQTMHNILLKKLHNPPFHEINAENNKVILYQMCMMD